MATDAIALLLTFFSRSARGSVRADIADGWPSALERALSNEQAVGVRDLYRGSYDQNDERGTPHADWLEPATKICPSLEKFLKI